LKLSAILSVLCTVLLFAATEAANAAQPGGQYEENATATLISEKVALQRGATQWLAVEQQIQPGWHTYWRYPGDSGAAPEITWRLPEGVTVSDFFWPYPERIPYGPLMNFGYEEHVYLLMEISISDSFNAAEISLSGKMNLLVCADICIPERKQLALSLPVIDETPADSEFADEIRQAKAVIPGDIDANAIVTSAGENLLLSIELGQLRKDKIQSVSYFPYNDGVIENPARQNYEVKGGQLQLELLQGWDYKPSESSLDGIIVIRENAGAELVTAFVVRPKTGAERQPIADDGMDLLSAILFALLGGMILNLMPCVFPVLSIKILSLVQHSQGDNKVMRVHGWFYVLGVVLSFVAVALVLILLKMGGAQIGWGFQLQSPVVVALLAYLFLLIGLNLSGFFQVGFAVMSLGGNLADREGYAGSFFTGVLATIVAAPCTVPFMAAAIGYALTQSPIESLLIFACLGLGMAVPYLLLCYMPRLLQRLPAPGSWMERLKEFMAFPMYASAVWLLWVLGQQVAADQITMLMAGGIMLAFAIWVLNHLPGSQLGRAVAILMALILLLWAISIAWSQERAVANSAPGEVSSAPKNYQGPLWDVWSPEKISSLRQDDVIFVNFTAAWCITCKVNEAVALNHADVKQLFEDEKVQYFKADWTNEDPQITAALEAQGRSGVPLYLLYRPGQSVVVLPQVLTKGLIISAITGV